jgi:hypothetical protein
MRNSTPWSYFFVLDCSEVKIEDKNLLRACKDRDRRIRF